MLGDRSYMRDYDGARMWSVSIWIVLVNVVLYALQLLVPLVTGNRVMLESFLALKPSDLAHGYVWQLLTFQFLHGGPFHLLINCAMLYMFGRPVEEVLGRKRFLVLYLGAGAFGGLCQAAAGWTFPSHFGTGSVVGASAGVFALIAAFAALNWEQPLTMLLAFVIPVTMRAKYLLLVELVLALLGMLQGRGSGIAHAAHLGGMIGGLLFLKALQRFGVDGLSWESLGLRTRQRELVSASRRKRSGWASSTSVPVDEVPSGEFISKEVDPILDKISAHGIQSLTEREKMILEAARNRMSKRSSGRS